MSATYLFTLNGNFSCGGYNKSLQTEWEKVLRRGAILHGMKTALVRMQAFAPVALLENKHLESGGFWF